jgi:hypothetical protein
MGTLTLPEYARPGFFQDKNTSGLMSYAQNIGGGQAGGPVLYRSTPSASPEIASLGSRALDYSKGLASQFKDYMFGNSQPTDASTLKNFDMNNLKTEMEKVKLINQGRELGLNPDGSLMNTGLLGKAQSFAGSNLAKSLGTGLMGAAQLGLGYKSFKEGQKMNKELIKDMRTNRANLAEDRARAAKDRETFSHMMNTL